MCRLIRRNLDQTELCLPVFYALLDPSLIPDANNLEHIITSRTEDPSIGCAMLSLDVLRSLAMRSSVIQDAAPDLWPRVWPWVQFMHIFRQFFPRSTEFISDVPILIGLSDNPQFFPVISATPGVRTIMADAWEELVGDSTVQVATKLLPSLSQGIEIFENFEEITTALGGVDKLILLVLKHMSLAIRLHEMDGKVALIADLLLLLGSTTKHGCFPPALLSKKLVSTVVSSLHALLPTVAGPLTWAVIRQGIRTSMTFFSMAPIHPSVREAVEAGLPRFIVSCAVKWARGPQMQGVNIYEELAWFTSILTQSLVSCSVVIAVHSAIKEVQSSSEMEEFAQVPLYSAWTTVATLVEQRADVLNSWKSAGYPWLAACNNMMVDQLCSSSVFTDLTASVEGLRQDETRSAVRIAPAHITARPTANEWIGSQVIGKFANLQNSTTSVGSSPLPVTFHSQYLFQIHSTSSSPVTSAPSCMH
jgi:hypothetical protein